MCAVEITSLCEFDCGEEIVSLSYNSCYRNTTQYVILLHPNESILENRKKTVHIRLTGSVYTLYITRICVRGDDGRVRSTRRVRDVYYILYVRRTWYRVLCRVRLLTVRVTNRQDYTQYTVRTYTYNTHVRGYIIMI